VRRALARIPIDASYNVSALDVSGRHVTAFLAPGRPAEFSDLPAVTNHRGHVVDWPEFAFKVRSVERHEHLLRTLASGADDAVVADAFLAPPMHQTAYSRGFGTLYTAVLRPESGTIDYRWPDSSWHRSFDAAPAVHDVVLREPGA
jgi:predicted choloylglycine hydrolase